MVRQSRYEILWGDLKSLAYTQQRKYGGRSSSLNHLPVTHTEAVGNHVFLAQSAIRPVGPDAVAQGTEEACITGREISTGAHYSTLRRRRAKTPRTKVRIKWRYPGICDSIPIVAVVAVRTLA